MRSRILGRIASALPRTRLSPQDCVPRWGRSLWVEQHVGLTLLVERDPPLVVHQHEVAHEFLQRVIAMPTPVVSGLRTHAFLVSHDRRKSARTAVRFRPGAVGSVACVWTSLIANSLVAILARADRREFCVPPHLGRGILCSSGNVQIRFIRVTLPSAYSHTSCSPSRYRRTTTGPQPNAWNSRTPWFQIMLADVRAQ